MRLRDRVIIGISGYQDYAGLAKLLPQVTPHVYKVVYCDGKYDLFSLKSNNDSFFSTDGSLELCKQYPNVEVMTYAGYQVDKRQRIADKAVDLGARIFIIIDTDEWIHPDFQDWDLFYDKLEEAIERYGRFHRVWNLMIYVEDDYELASNAVHRDSWSIGSGRIWYRPEELEYYAGVHYFVRSKATSDPHERLMSTDKTIGEGVRLITSSRHRSNEFKNAREKWAKDTIDLEQKFINAYDWAIAHADDTKKRAIFNPDLYPLIAILTDKENKERESGILQSNKHADMILVKHNKDDGLSALSKTLGYFRGHAGYTHLVLSTFDINWTFKDYMTLYKEVKDMDHTILSGYTMDTVKVDINNMIITGEPRADFTLHNEKTISPTELHSNPTAGNIASYIKLYRQEVIPVATLDSIPLVFIRNDVVRYIDEVNTPEYQGRPLDEVLDLRLLKLGIMRFVHLQCPLERVNLDKFNDVFTRETRLEFNEGKYERIKI
jgi:hypothetical protein